MKIVPDLFGLQFVGAIVTLCLQHSSVSAQSITPANDGTDTQINRDGNRYDIEGGSLSNDGENLFHSFEKFGLSEGEIANFLSNPDIINILGRVVGGDASIIHGLIQITGGNSNLFLINPAGVIFGANATLNIPADFTVTTATGIQFGQNWFNAIGSNNYSTLIGTPSGYSFAVSQPGVILNEANLTLSEGSNLTLLGGTVINTGELSSPGGQITIAAVEGENFVRISQEGQLLNLEITPLETNNNANYPITPLSLPELLTGGDNNYSANSVVISNGQVILQNSDTIIPEEPGTTVAAGSFNVGDNNIGGTVNIFSSNSTLVESEINTTGENIAGNILINSDNNITINQLTAETENLEIIAAQNINFNQITTQGYLTAETQEGNINRIGNNSLITAATVLFQTGETGSIGTVYNPLLLNVDNIEAVAGSGGIFLETNSPLTIGNVSEEEQFTGLSTTGGGEININVEGNLAISEGIFTAVDDTNAGNITLNSSGNIESTDAAFYNVDGGLPWAFESIETRLDASSSEGDGGHITLTAVGDITTTSIYSGSKGAGRGGDITFHSSSGQIDATVAFAALRSSSSEGDGGNISLTAEDNIWIDDISSGSGGTGTGGDINIESNSGQISTDRLSSSSSEGEGGNISLTANGNIRTENIYSDSEGTGTGGDITLNSNSGEINTNELYSFSAEAEGGNVSLTAEDNIRTNGISSGSQGAGRGGDVTLKSNSGEIYLIPDVFYDFGSLDSHSDGGDGGNVLIEAMGRITIFKLDSSGGQNGGNINIVSEIDDIDAGDINYSGESGNPGNLNIQAYSGSIELGEITSRSITIVDGGEDNPFTNDNPETNINSDTDFINNQRNEVILSAHNDITLNQAIESDSISRLELKAGRNININANIDLNANNGDILLEANAGSANPEYRESGTGNIFMEPGTILNAGEGDIQLLIGNFGEAENIGDITIADLQTTGNITVDARGGNIVSAADNSLITANSGIFRTKGSGAIGSESNPLRLNINTLEGITGSGGAFFNSPNQGITITEFTSLNRGEIAVTATDNITVTQSIKISDVISFSSDTNASGDITLNSNSGAINTTEGWLDSSSDNGNGGDVTLTANGNIATGYITSQSRGSVLSRDTGDTIESILGAINNAEGGTSGDITLNSNSGAIDTTEGRLNSSSEGGDAGNVTLTAEGNITTSYITSESLSFDGGTSGDITLNSNSGAIDTTSGQLESFSFDRDAGNVTLTADGNITTGLINSTAIFGNGGDISLESISGEINTTDELASHSNGDAGDITLSANGNITTSNLNSFSEGGAEAGNIIIRSRRGSIDTTGNNTITTIVSADSSFEEMRDTFGWIRNEEFDLELRYNFANIDTNSGEGIGGNVILEALGDITVVDISSWGGNHSGNVEITTSQGDINTGVIFSTARIGNGGSITLSSPQGKITTSHLLSSSEQGTAGIVNLDAAGHIETNSIRSDGLQQGGNITINSDSINSIEILGDLDTFSEAGIAGTINLDSPGNITAQNVRSFGLTESGDLIINSEANISTQAVTTQAGDGPSGNIIINGENIATGNVESIGIDSAGVITITATDGSVTTADITSNSSEGEAGGIDVEATVDINTEDQTVESDDGDATLTNEAGNDINTEDQTITASEGDASIENTGNNINIDNQTATIEEGNADVNNTAENDINANNQTATATENGNAGIENTGNNINVDNQTATANQDNTGVDNGIDQTAITEQSNASINNTAENNINAADQSATANQGDASLSNTAENNVTTENQITETNNGNTNISNTAENNITTENQITETNNGNTSINNTGNDINVSNQIARSEVGDITINNTAEDDVNVNNQTAITDSGDASINNTVENDININNQTAITEEGNTAINNTAGNDINVNNQTAITEEGNTAINNTAGNDININNQTAIANEGTATIENDAGGEINIENQSATQDGNPGTIINRDGDSNLENDINNLQNSNSGSDNLELINPSNNVNQALVNSEAESGFSPQETDDLNSTIIETQISDDIESNNINSDSDNLDSLNLSVVSPLSIASADAVTLLESNRNQEFADYFGEDFAETDLTTEDVRTVLDDITQKTGTRSAVVYVTLETNQLELVVFTAESQPQLYRIEISREDLLKVARQFFVEVVSPRTSQRYIKPAQQLYDWLIRPIEAHLQAAEIDTILLSLDSGLRGLPIAAIHDGEQFLVEKYSLSLIPSISLINTNYETLVNAELLAMGASEFTQLEPLPAVPVELELITRRRRQDEYFLNQEFTRKNLIDQRKNNPYSIIHFATHSDFSSDTPDESYIQLWQDEQLKLNQLRTSLLSYPPLELLVLSSCRTAVGDEKAEMGFAGLAIQARVKTALASLWYVNDMGTLALMSEFYRHLDGTPIKAEALRNSQLAMIQGNVEELETQLATAQSLDQITLPPQISSFSDIDLSHPYYWSGFTLIGSPW